MRRGEWAREIKSVIATCYFLMRRHCFNILFHFETGGWGAETFSLFTISLSEIHSPFLLVKFRVGLQPFV